MLAKSAPLRGGAQWAGPPFARRLGPVFLFVFYLYFIELSRNCYKHSARRRCILGFGSVNTKTRSCLRAFVHRGVGKYIKVRECHE